MHGAAADAAASEKRRGYLGCSILGHPCSRHLWYSFRKFPKQALEGRVKMLFNLGHVIEDEVIRWLRAAGFEVDGQQQEFTACDNWVGGHCDGVIYHPGILGQRRHILEVKSASQSSFEKFTSQGIQAEPKYTAQGQLYMGFAGLERCLFVVYNKNTSDIYTERLHFDRQEFNRLLEKAEYIITSNELPPATEDYFTCKFCDYSLICKGGEPIVSKNNCGSCKYHRWHGFKKACHHPGHPYFLNRYDGGCNDYVYMFEKAIPGQPPHWIQPVEEVKEYQEPAAA